MRRCIISILLLLAGLQAVNTFGQCCTIIDLAKENGTFTLRNITTGRLQLIKPDALKGAELKVGDTVDAGTYELLEPAPGDSCCVVTKFDTLQTDSVLKITALNISSGQNIYFNLPAVLRPVLDSGAIVFTRPSHGYAMIANNTDSTQKMLFGFPLLDKPQ